MANTPQTGGPISCKGKCIENLHAWINTMPPGPPTLIVIGEVEVSNPGVEVILTPTVPQGINPQILMLDIHLAQRPGIWPQVVTEVPMRYERPVGSPSAYTEVNVMCEGQIVASAEVQIVS